MLEMEVCSVGSSVYRLAQGFAACLWAASIVVAADDFPEHAPDIDLFLQDSAEQRPMLLRFYKEQLKGSEYLLRRGRNGTIDTKLSTSYLSRDDGEHVIFQSQDAKALWAKNLASAINEHKQMIAAVQKGATPPTPVIRSPLSAGQIGLLEFPRIETVQIVDDENMLAKIAIKRRSSKVDDDPTEWTMWIHGASTSGHSDGSRVTLNRNMVYQITGNKQYETVAGSTKTVLVLEALDPERWNWIQRVVKKDR